MKNYYFFFISLFLSWSFYSQTIYETIESQQLNEIKELKVQLPRNYSTNTEKIYPIILVLDGDYLFEPVAGNVDYYSYWEEMPEAIVVGVNHNGNRASETSYDLENFLPADKGAKFFQFIGMELLPYFDENYRTAKFAVIVGHDITANFMNYYLLKDDPLFQGYINLSPDYAPPMPERITNVLASSQEKVWFYQATASDDIKELKESILSLDEKLKTLENKNIQYFSDNFEGATHYSLVGCAIPKALQQFFAVFRPISKQEYEETILNLETSAYDYLLEKYATIERLFGVERKIRVNDILAIASALERNKNWEELEKLGELARDEYPDTMLGNYYLARSYEENGKPKKAYKTYQNAFILGEVAFITKDLVLSKADQLKADFGYN